MRQRHVNFQMYFKVERPTTLMYRGRARLSNERPVNKYDLSKKLLIKHAHHAKPILRFGGNFR